MSEPKFSVGDRVAVCAMPWQSLERGRPMVVITETFVNERVATGSSGGSQWMYGVDACAEWLYEEFQLRPLGPDDYTEETVENMERIA